VKLAPAVAACALALACQGGGDGAHAPGSGSAGSAALAAKPPSASHKTMQVSLPDALRTPPPDATKAPEGFFYKKLVRADDAPGAHRNDMLLVNYTGWKLPSGETFFTTRMRGQPMPVSLADPTPGFTDALLLLHKGEKADVWVPPEVGYRGKPIPPDPETLVYEVEVIDVSVAPPIPPDVAAPPAGAASLAPADVKYERLHAGSGGASPRPWDTIAFAATMWDSTGRMLETTELRKLAATSNPFRQPRVVQQVLSTMTPGERLRFWADATRLAIDNRPPNGMPKGVVCYEIELRNVVRAKHDPPPIPPDVAKPPADAQSTTLGVYYKVLASGAGPHPGPKDRVQVRYTGWREDGTIFETTAIANDNRPIEVVVQAGTAGWTDALQHMSPGDHWRIWIPSALGYKNAPGRPQGMLVYDVELVRPPDKPS
jgi:FKBP-type peptidyl-prolyl cis-trans isomerase